MLESARGLQPGEVGAGVVAFEGDGGECGGTFVAALRFGSPIDDATACVKDRDEVGLASNGTGVGHAGRSGVEVKPADDLSGVVVFDGLNPRFAF